MDFGLYLQWQLACVLLAYSWPACASLPAVAAGLRVASLPAVAAGLHVASIPAVAAGLRVASLPAVAAGLRAAQTHVHDDVSW